MKELTCQIQQNQQLWPYSQEDLDELKDYKPNQLVRIKVYGTTKQRSLKQLKTYWRACTKTADNLNDFRWNDKDKTDFQCRVALHFVDPKCTVVRPDGAVQFKYRSIAYDNLKHIEACRYFDRAFEIMALKLGKSIDDFLKNVVGVKED